MTTLEALLMGLLQGLTEYLPVSSSGHLTIASTLFGIEADKNLLFTITVHVATVLSTLVVLGREIWLILRGACRPLGYGNSFMERLNPDQRYILNIIVSMIPVGIIGLFFKDTVEDIFGAGLIVVGSCLILTAALLLFSHYAKPRPKETISLRDAFIIGLGQACAVLPGLSRSGTTIATGLLLGNNKAGMAQFSFLMVIPPILGEALLEIIKGIGNGMEAATAGLSLTALCVGFLAAFISGMIACKWMINLVKRGKLTYFAYYCIIMGVLCFVYELI